MKLYTGNVDDQQVKVATVGEEPMALMESKRLALEERLNEVGADSEERPGIHLEIAHTLLDMHRHEEAWSSARTLFDHFLHKKDWEQAIETTEIMFHCEQPLSLAALGQGIWLAVTFPVNPEISIEMLRLVVEETPDDADGAAVAAAVAHYLAEMRTDDDKRRENLIFYTGQLLSSVARRHSQVESQEAFNLWIQRMELDDPDKFLIRLRNIVDVLVQDDWWLDRDEIQASLPVN